MWQYDYPNFGDRKSYVHAAYNAVAPNEGENLELAIHDE
jgi:hypothetical protein